MTTVTFTERVTIDRPAHVTWQVVADYGRDPDWRQGVTGMAPVPAGIVQTGTTFTETMRFAGQTMRNVGAVSGVDPGRSFTWRTSEGANAWGGRTVVPRGPDRCEVLLELHVVPEGLMRLAKPLTARMMRTTLREDARKLRHLLEFRSASVRPNAQVGA